MAKKRVEAQLGLDTREYENKLSQANAGMQKFSSGLRKLSGAFAAFAAGAGAWGVVRKAIDSTETTADRFAITMAGVEGATNMLFKSIATGNLDQLEKRMRDAAAAGREYAAALDLIEDRQRAITIASAKASIPLSDLQEIFRDRTGRYSYEERMKSLKDYIRIYEEVQQQQIDLNEFQLEKTLKHHSTLSQLRRDELVEVIEMYNKMTETVEKAQDVITGEQKVKTKSSWWNELFTLINGGMYNLETNAIEVGETMAQITADVGNMTDEERRWYEMIKKYGTLSRSEIETLKNALIGTYQANAALNQAKLETIRIESQLTNEYKSQLAELKKLNEFTGKKINMLPSAPDTGTLKGGTSDARMVVPGIEEAISLVNDFEGAFRDLFANTGNGLKGMAKAFSDAVAQMAATLAAKAAIFGILSLLSGGAGGLGMAATKLLNGKGLMQFMGIPQFGGASLPSGGSATKIEVIGSLKGGDIFLSNKRTSELIGSST